MDDAERFLKSHSYVSITKYRIMFEEFREARLKILYEEDDVVLMTVLSED